MTKRAGIFVLFFALVSGLIASATVMKYVKNVTDQSRKPLQTAPVVITKVSIPAGSSILDSQIETVQRPLNSIPASAIRSGSEARGRIVRTTLYPGENILEERLIQPGSMGGLPSLIPIGMRAITLKVDDAISVSGFIRPGHYVDILTTVDLEGSDRDTVTKTILQSIQVIATGKEIENRENDQKAKEVSTVTVLVTLEQAERLALAANAGTIRLVLRNLDDLGEVTTEGVTLNSLIPQANRDIGLPLPIRVEETPVPVAPAPAPRMRVVEIYRGSEKSEVSFAQ